jgi:hypothetical protein
VAGEEWCPFHVQVGCVDAVGSFKLLGSGVVIQPQRVLTCFHVVKVKTPNLAVVWKPGGGPVSATVKGKDEAADVAVLETHVAYPGSFSHLGIAAKESANQPVEISGYPKLRRAIPSKVVQKVNGHTVGMDTNGDGLFINVTGAVPQELNGLSGAAVRIRGVVVGVLRAYPKGWKENKRLEAVPLLRFVDEPWFREAMGLPDSDSEYVSRIAALLTKWERLHQVLRGKMGLKGKTATATATAYSQLPAREGVSIADDVMNALREDPVRNKEEEGALRSIVNEWLPRAVDWAAVHAQLNAARVGGKSEIELPFRLETIAEIVCARSERRPCEFVHLHGTRALTGLGFLSWPASDYAPIFRTEKGIQEALIKKLGVYFPEIQSGAPESILGEIEVRLQYEIEKHRGRAHPLFLSLVVVDELLGGDTGGMDAWSLVTRPGVCPPSLRLIRLKGGTEERIKDVKFAVPLEYIYKKD